MRFKPALYFAEMQALIDTAAARWQREPARQKIYTIGIWTDPDAAASAVNIDTRASSERTVAGHNRYLLQCRAEYLAAGETEMAALFAPVAGRQVNPADFQYPLFAETAHQSFRPLWAERSRERCWQPLSQALNRAAQYALIRFAGLDLEADAVLGVNSREDWFGQARPIRRDKG